MAAATEKTPKIYEAISNVMKDIGIVGKNDSNDFDHYKYRGIDAVMNALNPAMVKNKVFVTPTVIDSVREERAGKNGTAMMYTVLTVKYTFYTDDGSFVECTVIGEAMDRSDKSTNKAMSAAYKYACFQTFSIPTEEMEDSEKESPEIGEKVKDAPAPKGKKVTKKTEEELNKEMEESVDQRMIPTADNKMTKEQYDYLIEQIKRTNSMADIVKWAKTEDLTTLSSNKCVAALTGLIKRPTVNA